MAVPAGRTSRLYGWNSYEWGSDYRYVAAGWTVTPTPTNKDASIALTPPAAYPLTLSGVNAAMGVLYGIKTGQGYDGKSTMVVAAAPGTVRLRDLRNATQYYLIPVMRTVDGIVIRGPESGMLTPP